jgi:DHA1 family bicyclomycin/chloramphenicol resistance-like MFS transporter
MSSSRAVRTVLPLASVTCTSMLAMDFYLPAVPSLQSWFGIGVSGAQATVAVFFAGLAASQLVWAEVMSRLGPRHAVRLGVWMLIVASIAAVFAPNIQTLIALRAIQGVAAGAATVVGPSVVRATLSDSDAVRGLAAIAMVEALVPALGPVLGAALLVWTDWRGTFVVLAIATLVALPFAVRAAPRELPGLDRAIAASYRNILSNRRFTRLAVSHALSMGALLTFIASAPQLMIHALGLGVRHFAILQVVGVAAFMILASQSGRISARIGAARAVQFGAFVQLVASVAMLALDRLVDVSFVAIAVFWFVFCAALAVRGPSAFSEALKLPASQLGRGSAIMVLLILIAGAVGTQLVAPFMGGQSASALLVGITVPSVISTLLVVPFPRRPDVLGG